jgi:hypothetical protein
MTMMVQLPIRTLDAADLELFTRGLILLRDSWADTAGAELNTLLQALLRTTYHERSRRGFERAEIAHYMQHGDRDPGYGPPPPPWRADYDDIEIIDPPAA